MPVIGIRNHGGSVTERLPQVAEALVAACVAVGLPGIDKDAVAVSDGGAALVKDDRFLFVDVLLFPGPQRLPSDAGRLARPLAQAAAALLDPEWSVVVSVEWLKRDMDGGFARERGSRVSADGAPLEVSTSGDGASARDAYCQAAEWQTRNGARLQERYAGQIVVIYRDAVVFAGDEAAVRAYEALYDLGGRALLVSYVDPLSEQGQGEG